MAEQTDHRNRCPQCAAPMQSEAIVCLACGHNTKIGMNVKTVHRAKTAGRAGMAVAVSAVVAFACAALWAWLAIAVNIELGILAWGIGIATGMPIVLMTEERNTGTGLSAAALALSALVLAKLLIVQWGAVPQITDELLKNDDYLFALVMTKMLEEKEFPPELMSAIENGETSAEQDRTIETMARERMAQMSDGEKHDLARAAAEAWLAEMSLYERISSQASLYDVLWLFLAVGSAYNGSSRVFVSNSADLSLKRAKLGKSVATKRFPC